MSPSMNSRQVALQVYLLVLFFFFFVLLYVHDIHKQMEINIVLYLMQCIFVHYRSCLKHTSKLNKIYNNTC